MNHQLHGRDSMIKRQKRRLLSAAVIIVIIILIAQARGWLKPVAGIVGYVTRPIQHVIYSAGSTIFSTTSKINNIPSLITRNTELEAQLKDLQVQLNDQSILRQENERLRNELNLLPREQYDLVGANIIGFGPNTAQSTRLINRGESSGITVGNPVIVQNGILIGKVVATTSSTSSVLLLTSDNSNVNVLVANKDILGVVRGDHGAGLLLDLIPQEEPLTKGDQLVTSGVGNDFPEQLTVGEIEEIKKSDNDVFQQAFIRPAADPRYLQEVFVIRNNQQ